MRFVQFKNVTVRLKPLHSILAKLLPVIALTLSGCAGYLPEPGPEVSDVKSGAVQSNLPVIGVTETVAQRVANADKPQSFAKTWPQRTTSPDYVVGAGDVLAVSIWEAPPAMLFGSTVLDPRAGAATVRQTSFPEQMVSAHGTINVPFAGEIPVAGKTPENIEAEIANRLKNKANQPQVLVQVTHNMTSNATVVGEVAQSVRMPLTAKGERLLDALATAGGVRQSVAKMTIQLSRDGQVVSMPLQSVIADPKQDVMLKPGDVVTALYQPLSFTALGASGINQEINFEASGISLAQALGRMGGTQDMRADIKGVFVFRFENPAAMPDDGKNMPHTPEGKVPVIYQVNMGDPHTFLVAQDFPVRNHDVIYIANAPGADLQKFLNIVTTSIYSIATLQTLAPSSGL